MRSGDPRGWDLGQGGRRHRRVHHHRQLRRLEPVLLAGRVDPHRHRSLHLPRRVPGMLRRLLRELLHARTGQFQFSFRSSGQLLQFLHGRAGMVMLVSSALECSLLAIQPRRGVCPHRST